MRTLILSIAFFIVNAAAAQWNSLPAICTPGFGGFSAPEYAVSDNEVIFKGTSIWAGSSVRDLSICRSTNDNLTANGFFSANGDAQIPCYFYSMVPESDTSIILYGEISGFSKIRRQRPNGTYDSQMSGNGSISYAVTENYIHNIFLFQSLKFQSMHNGVYSLVPFTYADLKPYPPPSLVFNNDSVGFLLGEDTIGNQVLLRTQDYGANWARVLVSPEKLNAMDFNGTACLLIGNNGIYYRSADVGNSWVQQTSFTPGNLTCLEVRDSVCYAGGENGILYKSFDLGASWYPENSGVSGTIKWIKLTNNGAGYFQSDNVLYKNNNVIGIEKAHKKKSFSIYPNPSSGLYSLDRNGTGFYTFEVDDVTGRKLCEGHFETSNYMLDLSDCQNGLYLLKLYDRQTGETITHRIIKQ